MKNNNMFAVIGLGRFGQAVAEKLAEMNVDVMAIDKNEQRVEEVANTVSHSVQLNATNESSLKEVGIEDIGTAIVAVGEDIASSILICSYLKNDAHIPRVIAKAIDTRHGAVLSKLSVDTVIYPEKESGRRLAERLVSKNIFDLIDLSDTHSIVELRAPELFVDRTIADLDLRKKYNVNVIAIKRKTPIIDSESLADFKEETVISPRADETIIKGDIVVIIGERKNLEIIKNL